MDSYIYRILEEGLDRHGVKREDMKSVLFDYMLESVQKVRGNRQMWVASELEDARRECAEKLGSASKWVMDSLSSSDEDFWGDRSTGTPESLLKDAISWDDDWKHMKKKGNIVAYRERMGLPCDERALRLYDMRYSSNLEKSVCAQLWDGREQENATYQKRCEVRKGIVLDRLGGLESLPFPDENDRVSLLTTAVYVGDPELLSKMLEKSPEGLVDARGKSGITPLWRAASRGAVSLASQLLSAGASPDVEGKDGELPIISGIKKGKFSVVGMLVAAGSKVDRRKLLESLSLVKEKSAYAGKARVSCILSILSATEEETEKFAKMKFSSGAVVGELTSALEKSRLMKKMNGTHEQVIRETI